MLGSRLALFVYAPFVYASSMDMLGSTLVYIYIYIYYHIFFSKESNSEAFIPSVRLSGGFKTSDYSKAIDYFRK